MRQDTRLLLSVGNSRPSYELAEYAYAGNPEYFGVVVF